MASKPPYQATKLFRRLGMMPPTILIPSKPAGANKENDDSAQKSRSSFRPSQQVNDADDQMSLSSMTPSELNVLNPEWRKEWVQPSKQQSSMVTPSRLPCELAGANNENDDSAQKSRSSFRPSQQVNDANDQMSLSSMTPSELTVLNPEWRKEWVQPSTQQSSMVTPSRLPCELAGANKENDDSAQKSRSSFIPSQPEVQKQDLVEKWVQELPLSPTPVAHHERPVDFKRKRSMIPRRIPSTNQLQPNILRATVTTSPLAKVSCSVDLQNHPASGHASSPSMNISIRVTQAEAASPSSSKSSHPAAPPDVVRQLFEARDKILAERRRQQQEEGDTSSSEQHSSYHPSEPSSSDSESEAESTPTHQDQETYSRTKNVEEEADASEEDERAGSSHNNTSEDRDERAQSNHDNTDEDDEAESIHNNTSEQGDEDNTDSDNNTSPARKKRRKVRVRQAVSSTRRERQKARNSGQSYVSSSGKTMPAKEAAPLGDCRKKCSTRVSPDQCSKICKEFWGMGKLDLRSAYLSNLIEVKQKASQRLRFSVSPSKRRNRQLTVDYHLVVNGENVPVCRGCFLKCFQVTPKFIELTVKRKMASTAGVTGSEEARGRTSCGLSEERLKDVREHLNSFPRYKSHYARKKTDKEFLNNNLTMKKMYDEYVSKYDKPVSRWSYEREFHAMNLSIKPLKIDTCNKCDTLEKAVMYARTEEAKNAAKLSQELHHRKAEKARDQKKADIEELKRDKTKRVVSFDLQQCLPTPHLQTSIVFYKRQLWVYNLTIHDCGSGKSVHNMWHEGEAERGPNEVGSALYKYLMELPNDVTEVTLWSDTCGGQNKNSIISAVFQAVIHQRPALLINQKFLVSGHTYLDCDTDHSVIEGKKKNAEGIHLPRDWYALVRNASKKFSVTLMDQSRQLDFKSLLKGRDSPFVKRHKNTDGEKFVWKDVVWLQHSRKNNPVGTVAYKTTHDKDAQFEFLNIKRKKKGALNLEIPLSYDEPRAIKQKKKDDLISMLHLIDPECRQFYMELVGDEEEGDTPEYDPDLLPSSSEDESAGED